jgi:YggT family protein
MRTFILALARLVDTVAWIYSLLVIARAVLSWFPVSRYHPAVQFLYWATEPLMRPIRGFLERTLHYFGPIDWSPLILLLAVYLGRYLLVEGLRRLAALL